MHGLQFDEKVLALFEADLERALHDLKQCAECDGHCKTIAGKESSGYYDLVLEHELSPEELNKYAEYLGKALRRRGIRVPLQYPQPGQAYYLDLDVEYSVETGMPHFLMRRCPGVVARKKQLLSLARVRPVSGG